VQDDFEVFGVERIEDGFRNRKDFLVERPFAVVGVPSGRREAGSEKDERVARLALFAEGPGFLEDLVAAGQGAGATADSQSSRAEAVPEIP
jgi:hypothetical protein